MTPSKVALHASVVCFGPLNGVLILGAAGQGKSTLALDLIDRGATLVADDRTIVMGCSGQLYARAPRTIAGLIEQRGLGILRLAYQRLARVRLVVDLDAPPAPRLPVAQWRTINTIALPCLSKPPAGSFSAIIQRYLYAHSDLETAAHV